MSTVKAGSKYFPLYRHLRQQRAERIVMSFAEIERLLGADLPRSARRRGFWSNRGQGGLQAAAWLEAGYEVGAVDLASRKVEFERPGVRYAVRKEAGEVRWDGAMVRALRTHLELDQAGMADVIGVRQQTISEWETGAYAPSRSRSKHLTLIAERAGFPLQGDFATHRRRPY
ncbi:MAG TPA: helix-turn-helix domain-containing protein [Anaerolineales bacterium]|nr:helix-turn-helix domain-containing protein [Anaerolineales bacterium]